MIESIKFRGKTLNYDPMTMPEFAEGWYYQELHNGDMRHLITDGAHTFEVDGNTVEMVSGLFDKPLAQRLTAEEKERVREEYSDNKCLIESASLSYVQREVFQKINDTLESIFGADFFKEGE